MILHYPSTPEEELRMLGGFPKCTICGLTIWAGDPIVVVGRIAVHAACQDEAGLVK